MSMTLKSSNFEYNGARAYFTERTTLFLNSGKISKKDLKTIPIAGPLERNNTEDSFTLAFIEPKPRKMLILFKNDSSPMMLDYVAKPVIINLGTLEFKDRPKAIKEKRIACIQVQNSIVQQIFVHQKWKWEIIQNNLVAQGSISCLNFRNARKDLIQPMNEELYNSLVSNVSLTAKI